MKIAYLITAYNNPLHLNRLVKTLLSPNSKCFIHIDNKVNIKQFSGIQAHNVIITKKRYNVFWGDYSFIKAILLLIRQALNDPMNFDRFVLLSGTDYPLHSVEYIENYFTMFPETEFIHLVQLPDPSGWNIMYRLTKFTPTPTNSVLVKFIQKVLQKFRLLPRNRDYQKALKDLTPYAGSTWWALTRDACLYIDEFFKKERRIVNYFKHTQIIDELIFHTIIGNSHLKQNVKGTLTYADWSKERTHRAHPELIGDKHVAFFTENVIKPSISDGEREFLFARKFSDDTQSKADTIDKLIENTPGS